MVSFKSGVFYDVLQTDEDCIEAYDKMPDTRYKLVTVNTAPERATRLIQRMTAALSDRYIIIHEANCESTYSMCH